MSLFPADLAFYEKIKVSRTLTEPSTHPGVAFCNTCCEIAQPESRKASQPRAWLAYCANGVPKRIGCTEILLTYGQFIGSIAQARALRPNPDRDTLIQSLRASIASAGQNQKIPWASR